MHPPAGTAPQRWSTDAVPPAQRLDYWVGAISEGFLAMDATSIVRHAFRGELVSAPLGPIGVNRVDGGAQQVWRTSRGVARSRDSFSYLPGNTESRWLVKQGELPARERRLRRPGARSQRPPASRRPTRSR